MSASPAVDEPPVLPGQSSGLFYGWVIIAVAFIGQAVAIGSTLYTFGFFVGPLEKEFGASRARLSNGLSLFLLTTGLVSPILGRVIDRVPIRWIMIAGACALSVGCLIMASATELWIIGLAFGTLVALGVAALGPLSASTLAANWFTRKRGQAMGIIAVATSAGGMLIAPVIAWGIVHFGWRGTLQGLAVAMMVTVPPLAFAFVTNRPEDRGTVPDGMTDTSELPRIAPARTTWSWSQLVRNRDFWAISVAVGMVFAIGGALVANLAPYATDRGMAPATAALMLSTLAFAGVIGKLVFGTVADRFDKRLLLWVSMGMEALFLWLLLQDMSEAVLILACCIAGVATGGFLPVWSATLADCFGRESYGTVMGLMSFTMMPWNLAGLRFAGEVVDRTGSYDLVWQTFIGVTLLSVLILSALRPPRAAGPAAG